MAIRNGVLVLDGFGASLSVNRGQLVCEDGIGSKRRFHRLSRLGCDLRRVVVVGHSGHFSFEAIKWIRTAGAQLVAIDRQGNVVFSSQPPRYRGHHLITSQVQAASSDLGLTIAKTLIRGKLAGQLRILEKLPRTIEHTIEAFARDVADAETATTITELRLLEAKAAKRYWAAWKHVPIRFSRSDLEHVPKHWTTFGSRISMLSSSHANASNPPNAILNFLFGTLAAEARIAILTYGLDPTVGMMHQELAHRDSLVYDVMEPVRPLVEEFVIDFLGSRTLGMRDVSERLDGAVQLKPHFVTELASTMPEWGRHVAPIVEWLAASLLPGTKSRRESRLAPKLLTATIAQTKPKKLLTLFVRLCPECGVNEIKKPKARICRACHKPPVRTPEFLAQVKANRAKGIRSRTKPDSTSQRAISGRRRGAWEAANPDKIATNAAAWPALRERLQTVPIKLMAEATGLSLGYCGDLRKGKKVPSGEFVDILEKLAAKLGV